VRAGLALLAICTWCHFALVIGVCFVLPTHGDWSHKLEATRNAPVLLPLMVLTLVTGWLCRDRRLLLITATVLAGLDGLIWSSRYWL